LLSKASGLRVSAAVIVSVFCAMLSVFCVALSVAGWLLQEARAIAVVRIRNVFFIFINIKRNKLDGAKINDNARPLPSTEKKGRGLSFYLANW
jgi:hypothetical protein